MLAKVAGVSVLVAAMVTMIGLRASLLGIGVGWILVAAFNDDINLWLLMLTAKERNETDRCVKSWKARTITGSSDLYHPESSARDFLNMDNGRIVQHQWMNFGLWERNVRSATFYGSSEALADKLMDVAGMDSASLSTDIRIADVGCGAGDFVFHLRRAGYRNITGIDFSQAQINLARDRWQARMGSEEVKFLRGDAAQLSKVVKSGTTFTHILCLDSAYHFRTRAHFLKESYGLLDKRGGVLGVVDFVIDSEAYNSLTTVNRIVFGLFLRLLSTVGVIPMENQCDLHTLQQQWRDAGFRDHLEVVDVTAEVFQDGFGLWIWSHAFKVRSVAFCLSLLPYLGISWLLRTNWRGGQPVIRCYAITGRTSEVKQ
eukprot:Clim_evm29s156 gene=Clim_evmTU29s156